MFPPVDIKVTLFVVIIIKAVLRFQFHAPFRRSYSISQNVRAEFWYTSVGKIILVRVHMKSEEKVLYVWEIVNVGSNSWDLNSISLYSTWKHDYILWFVQHIVYRASQISEFFFLMTFFFQLRLFKTICNTGSCYLWHDLDNPVIHIATLWL